MSFTYAAPVCFPYTKYDCIYHLELSFMALASCRVTEAVVNETEKNVGADKPVNEEDVVDGNKDNPENEPEEKPEEKVNTSYFCTILPKIHVFCVL